MKHKKKYYVLGITGIAILGIIMFFIFKFNESHNGEELLVDGVYTKEENTATIKVDTWLPKGFMGYVIESSQKEMDKENSLIKVTFKDDVEVVYANGNKFEYQEEKANAEECLIKTGSVVQVKYHNYENVNENGGHGKIYAEEIIEDNK